ncbi:MAG: hypothetical protein WCK47_14160 [bacterium]|nr:hypothetical protein [Candidatus Sumerlaeota bacterium]
MKTETGWQPLFDAKQPIVAGTEFNPVWHRIESVENTDQCKSLRLTGKDRKGNYDWEMSVRACLNSPLIEFTITANLPNDLTLTSPQPDIALWTRQTTPTIVLNQGPDSIYGSSGVPYGIGFPAAYLWQDGKEAFVFFDMTPMGWMSSSGVQRFHSCRIQAIERDGLMGLGLHTWRLAGERKIPSGKMVTHFYLYQAPRSQAVPKLDSLDLMVTLCAPLHPATSVIPMDIHTSQTAKWETFAGHAIQDLMSSHAMYTALCPGWADKPLELGRAPDYFLTHTGGAVDQVDHLDSWDFSIVNNHLTPWILFARLNPDKRMVLAGRIKMQGLPRFFDPSAGIIRWGTREPFHTGDLDMSWQNFFFHVETERASRASDPEDFNPAVAGKFLMAAKGLMKYGHNVHYLFSQFFNPYKKEPAIQADIPVLGMIREPWQTGTYAYIMLRAYRLTENPLFLDEAKLSIDTLLTSMTYSLSNKVYTRSYNDPADFPVTELFGNAYGAVAAQQIFEITKDAKYQRFSRDFLNTLLRLTFWYEDETDPITRELRNAGLFLPHGGAYNTCPWETAEAAIALASLVQHNRHLPTYTLLLKLLNLNRINSFYYYPAVYSAKVRALDPKRKQDFGQYWPIEPFYTLEGNGGHRGPTAAYMANNAMWNYWMYEALAEADDRDIMVLNTDTLDDYLPAARSVRRRFIVFNPAETTTTVSVKMKHVTAGNYTVKVEQPTGEKSSVTMSERSLTQGIPMTLGPMQYAWIGIELDNAAERQICEDIDKAQARIASAYSLLQEKGGTIMDRGAQKHLIGQFEKLMEQYQQHDYRTAINTATGIIDKMMPEM